MRLKRIPRKPNSRRIITREREFNLSIERNLRIKTIPSLPPLSLAPPLAKASHRKYTDAHCSGAGARGIPSSLPAIREGHTLSRGRIEKKEQSTLGNKTRVLSDRRGTYWRLSKTPLSFQNGLEKFRVLRCVPRDLSDAGFRHTAFSFAKASIILPTNDLPDTDAHGNRSNTPAALGRSTSAPMATPVGKPAPIAERWYGTRDHTSGEISRTSVFRSPPLPDMFQPTSAATMEKETGQDLPRPSPGVPEPDTPPLLGGWKTPAPRDVARISL